MIKSLSAIGVSLVVLAAVHPTLHAQGRGEHREHVLPAPKPTSMPSNRRGSELVEIEFADLFSYDAQGSIPPNATLDIDLAAALGQSSAAYDVVGVGWEITIDAFGPSWLSDVSISFGNDPAYQNPAAVIVPGQGDDFFDFRTYDSGGIHDLTNWNGSGTDFSFETASGVVHFEFFEAFDDFIGFPDAWFRNPSTITLEVVRVPEPAASAGMLLISLGWVSRRLRGITR